LRSSPKSLSNLVLPLNFRGRVLGAINLESNKLDGFKAETRVILTSLADQLAGAIYWAQLNQTLAEKTRELETQRAELEIQRAELAHANRKLKLANAKLEKSALSDPLTSLANRRAWDNHVKREFARAQRSQRNLSVAIIDADNFKAFNDRFGHAAGDRTLKRISAVLAKYTRRSGELAARLGGEEFGLLLPEIEVAEAKLVCERLLAEIAELKGCTTISIGLKSAVPTERGTVEKFVELADRALYQAKRAGRNQLTLVRGRRSPVNSA
jgi:diguanylate cyclase (GGDEF)-like protein